MFEADKSQGASRWHVIRLRGGSTTEIVLLTRRFFEVTTHWVGHTIACAGAGCELCELLPARGLFYHACHVMGRVHLVELGAQAASHMEQAANLLHGGFLPGQEWLLKRRTDKSPIHSECTGHRQVGGEVLPIQLAAKVMAIYKYPCPNPYEEIESYDRRLHEMAVRRCRSAAVTLKGKEAVSRRS